MSVRDDVITALMAALDTARTADGYSGNIKSVTRLQKSLIDAQQFQTPMVFVIDLGQDELKVKEDSTYRYAMPLRFYALVMDTTESAVHTTLNNVIADLRKFLNSAPDLGDSILSIRHVTDEGAGYSDAKSAPPWRADVSMRCELLYTSTAGVF